MGKKKLLSIGEVLLNPSDKIHEQVESIAAALDSIQLSKEDRHELEESLENEAPDYQVSLMEDIAWDYLPDFGMIESGKIEADTHALQILVESGRAASSRKKAHRLHTKCWDGETLWTRNKIGGRWVKKWTMKS